MIPPAPPTLESIARQLAELHEAVSAPPQRYQSVARAATYADLSEKSIRRLLAAGKLTALQPVRGSVRIDRLELDALLMGSTSRPRKGRGR